MKPKDALRKTLRESRDAMTQDERLSAGAKIAKNALWLASDVKRIGIYLSMKSEVDTIEIITSCLLDHKEVYLPKVQGKDLRWIRIFDFKSLKASSFGVLEPTEGESIDIGDIELMFVPMLGFDSSLHRVGYGAGFYDRALKNYAGKKIGLCYASGQVDTIDTHPDDIPVDVVITEHEIISKHL
jgi:5-formyltetrahydrofolate cyclo-ligase